MCPHNISISVAPVLGTTTSASESLDASDGQTSPAIVAVAVLAVILGVLLLSGLFLLVAFVLYRRNSYVHKQVVSAIQCKNIEHYL